MKTAIHTDAAPKAIGTYSQAIRAGDQLFLSGQIPLDPSSMQMVSGGIEQEVKQVIKNLEAVAVAAGASLDHLVKVNVYLVDLSNFEVVNQIMAEYLKAPYPARAAVQVSALPKGAQVEMDAVLHFA